VRREELVAGRKRAGKSQEQVAHAVDVDRTTVGKWERGESTPQPHQRPAYADALKISLHELDQMLTSLPLPTTMTPVWLAQYLGMEMSASQMQSHENQVLDGLLQTPAYAAAIARSAGVGDTPDEYIERNIAQRATRQARLLNGELQLAVVHPETVLRLRLGDDATMAAQMDWLIEVGEHPNVTIQIVPFTVGQYEAMRMGGFKILAHPWIPGHTIYVIRHEGAVLVAHADEADNYSAAWRQASRLALPPDESAALIKDAAEQWRTR
jgi:transcriptional regulator with XRE-family HTH domain